MATATQKKARESGPIKKTVCPLFLDQHGQLNDKDEPIECFAEDIGSIRLYRFPKDPKKPRTMVAEEDYWMDGWEFEEDGVTPDEDTITFFEFDPYTTTQKDVEKQFGKGRYYVDASWGPDVPDKHGLMQGAHPFVCEGPERRRGKVVPEKKHAPEPPPDSDPEAETAEEQEVREALEARDAEIEKLRTELAARSAPSPMSQIREVFEVFGKPGDQAAGQISHQREQWWQEQLATERQQAATALNALRNTAANDLSTVRSELTGMATAASIRYEGQLNRARDDANTVINALNAQIVQMRDDARKDLAMERDARSQELTRRETASEQTISSLKTQLAATENRLSDLRRNSDDKISTVTGAHSTQLLEKMTAELYLNFEREKIKTLSASLDKAEKERDSLRDEREEMRDTIDHMKKSMPSPDALAAAAGEGGFHISGKMLAMLAPVIPMIAMMIMKFFMSSGKPIPKEAEAFFEQWQAQTGGKGDPGEWAAAKEQARAQEEYEQQVRNEQARAEHEEHLRAQEEQQVKAQAEEQLRIQRERERDQQEREQRERARVEAAAAWAARETQIAQETQAMQVATTQTVQPAADAE